MTARQGKAIEALLTCPTQRAAAKAAKIAESTLREWLKQPEFQEAYKTAVQNLLTAATRKAQRSFSPAIDALQGIVADDTQQPTARIQAARAILEYGLKLTETTDIFADVQEIERILKARGEFDEQNKN